MTTQQWDKVWKDEELLKRVNEIYDHYDLGLKLKYWNGSILEAGCGIGQYLYFFEKILRRKIYGVDNSEEAIKSCGENGLFAKLGDLKNIPYYDNDFETVTSMGVIEHFEDKKDVIKVIKEMHRVLKPEGILYITVPMGIKYKLYRLQLKLRGKSPYYTDIYSFERLRRLLEENGFEIIEKIPKSDLSKYMRGYVCRKVSQ